MPTIDKKYYHNIDLDSNELKAGRIYNLTTAQRSALSLTATDKGYVVYDTTSLSLYIWNGTTWTTVAGGVSSLSATGPITVSASTGAVNISTSMSANKLIGRTSTGTGVMEEITVGTGLTLSSGTLSATSTGIPHATASGTDTYTTTITGVTAYTDGDAYIIQFTNGNTDASTLNINSLGARSLYRNNDGSIIGGDIVAGGEMLCVYDNTITGFRLIGTSPNTLYAYVVNADSVTITRGQPVYAFGSTGNRMSVKLAYNTTDSTSAQTYGLVYSSSIAANQKGIIIIQGVLDGLNLGGTWVDGDPVYLGSTAGSLTKTKPYAPNHLVYLGVVERANAGNGIMYVRVQNGYELDELHDVQAKNPTLKDTLYYDNTVSPAQWKTASISTILGYTPQSSLTSLNGILYANGSNVTALQKTSSNIQLLSWETGNYSFKDYISLPIFNTTDKGLVPAATIGSSTDLFLTSAGTWARINLSAIANQVSKTILANTAGSAGPVSAVSISSITTDLSTVVGDTGSGGTQGIVPAPSAGDAAAGKFLKADGTWKTPSNQTITLTGDVTGSGTSSFSTTIANSVVSLAKMSNLAANSIIGNNTGSSATPLALTGTQATTLLDTFTSSLKGLAPASGGGTTNFLRADGTWAAPSGGSSYTFSTGLTNTSSTITANLSTGVSGGQSVIGGTASGNSLTLSSTSHATKGTIIFGTSAYDEANNRLGIGTTTPSDTIDVVVSSANVLRGYRAADTSGSASIVFHKSRGTASSPTAVQNADGIGVFNFGGYDGSAFINTAYFGGVCEATPTANTVPIGIRFVTGTTVANRTERLRIDSLGNIGIGQSTPTHKVEVVAGTLTDGQRALEVTATMPTTITALSRAVYLNITSAGSSSFTNRGLDVNYAAGYTGSSATACFNGLNSAAGTASISTTLSLGNFGISANANGTTTGTNIGSRGTASNGDINIGNFGYVEIAKNSATNIGVIGLGLNTGSSPIQIGGFFGLMNTKPTFTSAALMSDNGSTTDPIFVARDNGTSIFSINDVATDNVVSLAAGTILDGKNALRLTATMPTTITSTLYAVDYQITTAGSSTIINGGFNLDLLAGYTGSASTRAGKFINAVAGTGTTFLATNSCNLGVFGSGEATTTGTNIGIHGNAQGGNISIGVNGKALTLKNSATNIGVTGFGLNTGTSPINIGGYFGLQNTTPTFTSAALMADNGSQTDPIFVARDNGTSIFSINDVATDHVVSLAAGTILDGKNAMRITATMPTTITSTNTAFDIQITSAGSSSFQNRAVNIDYLAGYTGNQVTSAYNATNSAAGTGTDFLGNRNQGAFVQANATTTGSNVGAYGSASNGDKNAGVIGRAVTAKNSATNIAVLGFALNTGTSPVQVGGFFGLMSAVPSFTSAALMCDNGSQTDPIFVARDNGTVVVQLSDGGFFGIGNGSTAATSQLQVNKNQNSVTQADANGILLANSTAAIAGTQSISPPIVWQGNGWSTGSSASQDVRFRADVLPTQSSNANATWRLSYSLNGAAYSNAFTVDTVGAINFALAASFSSSVTVSGVLIQSNFRASTNNAYQSTQFLVGLADTATQSYRTTNAGSDVNTRLLCVYNNSNSSSGTLGIVADAVNGLMFTAANGTRMISRAAITIGNLTNTAGSEAGDLLLHTQSGGTAYSQKMRISGLGNVVLGAESALSTSATDGFAYMPSGSGAPSGTPTSYTGKKAFYYDATNDRIYIYNGAWKMIQLI